MEYDSISIPKDVWKDCVISLLEKSSRLKLEEISEKIMEEIKWPPTRKNIFKCYGDFSSFTFLSEQQHFFLVVIEQQTIPYFKGTLTKDLVYRKNKKDIDVAEEKDLSDRKSLSGYCFMLNKDKSFIFWKTKAQSTIALSTCKAEYMAMAYAMQEGI